MSVNHSWNHFTLLVKKNPQEMRRAMIVKWVRKPGGIGQFVWEQVQEVWFHQWVVDREGNIKAVVEIDEEGWGKPITVDFRNIRFIEYGK